MRRAVSFTLNGQAFQLPMTPARVKAAMARQEARAVARLDPGFVSA